MRLLIEDRIDPELAEKARAFCAASPAYSYLQDPHWADIMAVYQSDHGYTHVMLFDQDDRLFCYGLLRCTHLPLGYAVGTFRRGPITAQPQDLQRAIDVFGPELRRRGFISFSLNPRWEGAAGDGAEATLEALSGRVAPAHRQRLHSCTGLIDLSPAPEEIIASCSSHARRNLRKIDRLAPTITPVETEGELRALAGWCAEFAEARGLSLRGLPSLRAQQKWAEAGNGIVAIVRIDGEPVGGFSLLRDGPRLFNLSIGWRDAAGKLPRSYMIYWYAICHYGGRTAETKVRWIDCAGRTDPRVDRKDPSAEGRERFKDGFPQQKVRLPRIHQIPLRPALFKGFDLIDSFGS